MIDVEISSILYCSVNALSKGKGVLNKMIESKRILVVVIFIFVASILSSCYNDEIDTRNNQVPVNTSVLVDINQEHETGEESNNIEISKLKNFIKNAINDLNWYTGENSEFCNFRNTSFNMEVFKDKNESLWVFFENSLSHNYYAALFSKGKDGEYINEPFICYTRSIDKKKENYTSIQEKGYTFFIKDRIQFGDIIRPQFPPITKSKEEVFKTIEELVTETIRNWGLKNGIYNIFIRNFRDNDITTSIVIEDGYGNSWILDVNVVTLIRRDFYEVKNENSIYMAKQYKKVSAVRKQLEIR